MNRIVTLLGVVAVVMLLQSLELAAPHGVEAAMMLGFVLLSAYLAGGIAASIGLPRLTGYVLLGITAGPFVLGILDASMVESLRTIDELALALIALTAGGELKMRDLQGMIGTITGLSLGVFLVVTLGVMLFVLAVRPVVPFLAERPVGFGLAVALLLGIWCANSSPDATIAVINETGAHGELTETILGVTIFKDVLVIIALAAALSLARPLVSPDAAFDPALLGTVAWEVGGAVLVGGLAGWGLAVYLERIGARSILATLVFTYVLTLLAHGFHIELLLTAVAAGFVIENFSDAGDRLIHAIEANALAVFAIFFALAGAALDLHVLAEFWLVGLAIVVVRAGLTWAGARAGARAVGAPPLARRLVWLGLISQAGVTLGLSLLVEREFPSWGGMFVTVTTAAIIFHLLLGPVLLKYAIDQAGEHGREPAEGSGAAQEASAPSSTEGD